MTRRFAVLAGALLAAVSFSSCSTFDRNDVAAAIGDETLTVDDLGVILQSPLAGAVGPIDVANADIARNVLEVWITNTVIINAGLLGEFDEEGLREALTAQLGESFTNSPKVAQDLLIVNNAVALAQRSGEIDDAEAILAFLDADVWVNARYGSWDAPTQSVLPFGGG